MLLPEVTPFCYRYSSVLKSDLNGIPQHVLLCLSSLRQMKSEIHLSGCG